MTIFPYHLSKYTWWEECLLWNFKKGVCGKYFLINFSDGTLYFYLNCQDFPCFHLSEVLSFGIIFFIISFFFKTSGSWPWLHMGITWGALKSTDTWVYPCAASPTCPAMASLMLKMDIKIFKISPDDFIVQPRLRNTALGSPFM